MKQKKQYKRMFIEDNFINNQQPDLKEINQSLGGGKSAESIDSNRKINSGYSETGKSDEYPPADLDKPNYEGELKEKIEYWETIEKEIDKCSKEDYKEFTRLERLWMNCPINELKAELKGFQKAQEMMREEIEKECEKVDAVEVDIGEYDKFISAHNLNEFLSKIGGKE